MSGEGTVTAGNASSQNDAASVCLVVGEDKLEELGLKAMGYLKGWSVTGVPSGAQWESGRYRPRPSS